LSHSDLYAEVDRSAYTNAIAKSSPITKTFFALSTLAICVFAPTFVPTFIVPIIVFILCTILILGVAKVKLRLYLNLLIYPTIMAAISCIFLALFFGTGDPIAQFSLPWTTWSIYKSGILTSVITFFRVEGALSCLFFLILTTSITDLSLILRRVHVPKVLLEISLLIYRYIFVFLEVAEQMTIAQLMRLGKGGWMKRIRGFALLAGNLFIRSLEQAERTFTAMNARGYDGPIYVLEDFPKSNKLMLIVIVLFNVLFALVVYMLYLTNFGVL
jgi:cobalt/nickel transport system permease protein